MGKLNLESLLDVLVRARSLVISCENFLDRMGLESVPLVTLTKDLEDHVRAVKAAGKVGETDRPLQEFYGGLTGKNAAEMPEG